MSMFTIVFILGIIALSLLLLAGSAGAAPLEEWNRTFVGARDDTAYSVQQTSDGSYILAGYTELDKPGMTNAYALLIKTDTDGSEQWNRTFGGTAGDAAYSVQQTKDDAYILAGNTKSYGSGGSDAWLVKVSGTPAKAPTASPTQTLTAVSTETQTISLTEKIAGFEIVLVIAIILTMYLAGRKRG